MTRAPAHCRTRAHSASCRGCRLARSGWTCRSCARCSGCRASPAPRGTHGGTAPASDAMGPLRADCVLQLLRLTRRYRSKWTTTPTEVACVEGVRDLRELLDAPSAARTVHMRLAPSLYAAAARASSAPERDGVGVLAATAGAGRRCPQRCGLAGWCFERGGRPGCACFHEALRDAGGSCARLTHASPPTPRSRLSTAWVLESATRWSGVRPA